MTIEVLKKNKELLETFFAIKSRRDAIINLSKEIEFFSSKIKLMDEYESLIEKDERDVVDILELKLSGIDRLIRTDKEILDDDNRVISSPITSIEVS